MSDIVNICPLSDTHGFHRKVVVPPGTDLILFAGDCTNHGELDILTDFNDWVGSLNIPVVGIAGNHDRSLEKCDGHLWLRNMTYLRDEVTEVLGLRIYGSPMARRVADWAFGYEPEEAEHVWDRIPRGIDILLTHGPIAGELDHGYGCPALRRKVLEIHPRLFCHGHIHESRGTSHLAGTEIVNASFCNWPNHSDFLQPKLAGFRKP